MKSSFSNRLTFSIGTVALAAMLLALALLQYTWSREVSEAAGARMRASLQSSVTRFREDFNRELGSLVMAVAPDSASETAGPQYLERIESWKHAAVRPDLLQNIYVLRIRNDDSRLLRLNLHTGQFEATDWPPSFSPLKQPLMDMSADMPFFGKLTRGHEEHGPRDPHFGTRQLRVPWFFDEAGCILLHPFTDADDGTQSWILFDLNDRVIAEQVLPSLAQDHFAGTDGLEYDVAVVDRDRDDAVIYSSTPQFDPKASSDASTRLFGGLGHGDHTGPPMKWGAGPSGDPAPTHLGRLQGPPDPRTFGFAPVHIERFHPGDPGPGWELVVKHRKGSLEAALTSMHRRQLAIGFGVLALLSMTLGMIVVTTRRAQRLAALQVEFVTGVSHELRTPLAVIGSAAENIADGIVDDKNRVRRYGAVIRDQARYLTRLVEQILLFAATRKDSYQYNRTRVRPVDIINIAVDNSSELIRASGFQLEQEIEPDLPEVLADAGAVSHCLQNLITNACKYSGDSHWLKVRAAKGQAKNGTSELHIAVEDKGIGIANSDLNHIFDPFYRSPSVANAQIHGTGLGLALAKSIAEAMDGNLSVESELGKGSTFTLHLPFVPQDSSENEVQLRMHEQR